MPNLAKKYIKRDIFEKISSHLNKAEITLITGARQVGKTVLLNHLKDYLILKKAVKESAILFYNLDIVQDWEVFQNQTDFINFLKSKSEKQKIYVFVDEAQRIEKAARFFKGVYDSNLNIKLVLTGSSSLELKAGLKESLAGRKMIFQLAPFSFSEFLLAKNQELANFLKLQKEISKIEKNKILNFYKEYLVYGGYPRVVLSSSEEEKIDILKEIYSSYIEKDIVGLLEIKNKNAFIRLIKLLAGQIGQLVNIGELAANLGIDRQTAEKYILALEETFIAKRISPYFTNPRQEVIKAGKIYFLDLGIRNLALESFGKLDDRIDRGVILENAVFIEIISKQGPFLRLRFWRTKQGTEVDFVVEKGARILPIEIKFAVKNKQIPLGIRSFIKKFSPPKALLINLSHTGMETIIERAPIYFSYPFEINRYIKDSA